MSTGQASIGQDRRLRGILLLGGLVGITWLLAGWILTGASDRLVLTALGIVGVMIVLTILRDWRTGFYLFIVWLLFEDLVRKYLGNNMVIYFGKDVLVGVTYLAFFLAWRKGKELSFRPKFLLPLMLFLWLGIAQVFNTNSPSLMYGLLGAKLYFFYIPLMWVGYALLREEKDIQPFLYINMGLAGVIALLGSIQAIAGPGFLNPAELAPDLRLLSTLQRVSPITGQVIFRPTSVFVSDGRFAWYLFLMWVLGFGAAGYLLLRTMRGRKLIFLAIGLVTAAIVLSGARGTLLYTGASALVMAAAFLWGAPWKWGQAYRSVRAIRRAFLLAAVGVVVLLVFYPQAIGARFAFYTETLSPDSPASEVGWRAWGYPIKNLEQAFAHEDWMYGYGIGTSSLGVQYVSRWLGEKPLEIGVESGFGTLVVEMGILGLLLWLVWVFAALRACWQVVRGLRGTVFFPVAFAIFWFALLLLVPFTYMGIQPYQNFVLNAYLWLLLGVLFRLPKLLEQGQSEAAVAASQL